MNKNDKDINVDSINVDDKDIDKDINLYGRESILEPRIDPNALPETLDTFRLLDASDKKYINFDIYLPKAVPLTLIAFKGGDLVSKTIRILEKWKLGEDEFSHVGILINKDCCPFIPELEKGKIYVWESTMSYPLFGMTDGVPDVSGKNRFGVQIRDLREVIRKYISLEETSLTTDTRVAYCKLISNPWLRRMGDSMEDISFRRRRVIKTLKKVYKKYGSEGYELNPIELLATIFDCCHPVDDIIDEVLVDGIPAITSGRGIHRDDQVFCSEFIAIIYKSLGIFPEDVKTYRVTPSHFFIGGIDEDTGIKGRTVMNPIDLRVVD